MNKKRKIQTEFVYLGKSDKKIDLILFVAHYSAVEWLYMGLISFSDSTQNKYPVF